MSTLSVTSAGRPLFAACLWLSSTLAGLGQSSLQKDDGPPDEETVSLSAYVVNSAQDKGYASTHALGATRVNISLMESPISVTTVNRALLDDVAALDVTDALKYISSVNDAGNLSNGQFNVRGSNMRLDYQDGLPLNSDAVIHQWDMDLFERLEVIKGPAGTLYGSHQLGGLVNRVAKRPLSVRRTTIGGLYDDVGPDEGTFRNTLDHTGPVGHSKRLLYRLVGTYQTGHTRSGGPDDRRGLSLTVDYHVDAQTRIWGNFLNYFSNVIQTGQWQVDTGNNISYSLGREFSVFATPSDSPALNYNRTWFYEGGYETVISLFGIDWSARLVGRSDNGNHDRHEGAATTALQFYNAAGTLIGSGTPAGIFANPSVASIRTSVNSVRTWRHRGDMSGAFFDVSGSFNTGPVRHKLITYVQSVNRKSNRVIVDSLTATNEAGSSGPFELWPQGLPKVVFSESIRLPPIGAISDYTKSTAFNFGVQDNIWLWKDRIVLVGGARYDWAENDSINRVTSSALLGQNFSNWVYKYGVVYRPIETISLYFNHSETFNPVTGGFDDFGNALKNEEGNNDEFGVKFDMLDHRLVATASYFDSGITNKLVSVAVFNSSGNLQVLRVQTGNTTTKGWEADIAYQPFEGFSIIGGLGDVEIRNENGVRLQGGSYGVNYRGFAKYSLVRGPAKGLGIGAGYSFTNDRAGDSTDSFTLPAYGSWDGLIQYSQRSWSVQLNIINVTDKTGVRSSVVRGNVQPLEPRRLRASFRYSF